MKIDAMSKEYPIIFNTTMVRAILDGSKTVTRRVVKDVSSTKCPYGQTGDVLWVRETWGAWPHMCGGLQHDTLRYRADGEYQNEHNAWRWRPSIHMPRWASRITLEITDIRVEKLWEITEEDVEREGTPTWVIKFRRIDNGK